jgi:fucose 4-O-acetylase-like acetyltransferase
MKDDTARAASPAAAGRLFYLDWIRILTIGGVFVAHSLLPFSGLPWLINSTQSIVASTPVLLIANQFGMPLLFMVSGAATWFSLRKRSGRQFALERFQRLIVPYLVFTLLLSPIQAYYEAIGHGKFEGGLIAYLPQFFNLSRFTAFDLTWAGAYGYHLWFLVFLFAFAIVSLPLFLYMRQAKGGWISNLMARVCGWPGGLLLLAAPIALSQVLLRASAGNYQGWADFFFWGLFYVYGYLFISDPRADASLDRGWKSGLAGFGISIAALAAVAIAGIVELASTLSLQEASGTPDGLVATLLASPLAAWAPVLYAAVFSLISLNAWSAVLFLMSVMKRKANVNTRALPYLGEVAMPLYLIHHPVIVVFGFYIVRLDIGGWPQLLVLMASTLAISIGIIELFVRRIGFLRHMLGLRPAGPGVSFNLRRTALAQVVFAAVTIGYLVLLGAIT